jgi:hypothetical protein
MLLSLLVFAQLSVPADSTYSSAALRDLVARAAVSNHAPPPAFRGYRAHVETEMSLLMRDTLGRERAAQIEQVASSVKWTRGSDYGMHVLGYRAQTLGPSISSLSFLSGWTEPSLYGERILLGAQFITEKKESGRRGAESAQDVIVAVHPFAADRDLYYRFSGGDTVTVLRSPGRSIPIVRLRVAPHLSGATRFAAFRGEIDLDATREQIVRMRGEFVVLGKRPGGKSIVEKIPGLVAVAYCEFVNAEIDQRYWLPAFQRTELQTSLAVLGRDRAVMRIVSKFTGYNVDDTSAAIVAPDDSSRIPRTTVWAPSDSISHFSKWDASLGAATMGVTAGDFDDLEPDAWKSTGATLVELIPTNWDNVVRYNRVEGLFTGAEVNVRMRSAFPGFSYGGSLGWAWTERTARGSAHASLVSGLNTYAMGVERSLASTNDWTPPGQAKSAGINGAFASFDDFDYVDRRTALATFSHIVGSVDRALITVRAGAGSDAPERARLTSGLVFGGTFRPNRGSDAGSYALGEVDGELHPSASEEFVQPGFGSRVHYEIGHGQLSWQRVELGVTGREYWGPIAISLRFDGGAVTGSSIPPQVLFELGGSSALSGYEYKQFAGDRAMLFRSYASYTLPILRAPHRIWRTVFIPGIAPGFGLGFQGGWTEISSDAARASVLRLGMNEAGRPVSVATDAVRATFGFGATLFSGTFHLGVARPVDRGGRWKLAIGFGPSF